MAHAATPTWLSAAPTRIRAPTAWRSIEFASDIHLSEAMPHTAAVFFDYIEHTSADAVCLLGDVFELWVGDDMAELPGFERDCINRLAHVARRRPLLLMVGNRDFLISRSLLQRNGIQMLDDPVVLEAWGDAVLLTHGDALCLDDEPYQRFRRQVRNPQWQEQFLSQPFEDRQALARHIREASEAQKSVTGSYADIDQQAAAAWLQAAQVSMLVHGHTHRPQSGPLTDGFQRHVLSDWDADGPSPRGDVLRWTPTGMQRLQPLAGARTSL